MIRALTLAAILAAGAAQAQERVVSIGGSVTEIVHALGQGDRLIARDTTSTYPEGVTALPDVGYMRALSPEGVLSTSPDLVLAEEGAGPPEALEVLKGASIPVVMVPNQPSAEGVLAKVRLIGEALDAEDEAEALAITIGESLDNLQARIAGLPQEGRKRVLFVLSTQGGRILASGTGTSADAIIAMAGGVNAVTGFPGYKPLTDEAVIEAAPDAILMMIRGGDHAADDAELLAMPAVSVTPAARTGTVIRMDGLYLLGFGPRTADAASDLASALYGE